MTSLFSFFQDNLIHASIRKYSVQRGVQKSLKKYKILIRTQLVCYKIIIFLGVIILYLIVIMPIHFITFVIIIVGSQFGAQAQKVWGLGPVSQKQ